MSKAEKPLTARAFARLTGIGIHTVNKAIDNGDLKTFEFGGRTLIPASEVERITKTTEQKDNDK